MTTKETFTPSPLRYPGGKGRALKQVMPMLPPSFLEYREPFFGGGSVGIRVAQQYEGVKKFSANDKNTELISFWKDLKDDLPTLVHKALVLHRDYIKDRKGRLLYNMIVDNLKHSTTPGLDFFILNRITFSGVVQSGGYSEESSHKRFTRSSIDRLLNASEVIQKFTFTNRGYESVIKRKGDGVFIFLDPPYYDAEDSKLYGKNGDLHTGFDHKTLCDLLGKTKHTFLMTIDDSPFIRDLYDNREDEGIYIRKWQLQYGMNNTGKSEDGSKSKARKGDELFISNYQLPKS